MRSRIRLGALLLALAFAVTACGGARPPVHLVVGSGSALAAAHNDTSTPFNLVSVPALIDHEYDGRALRLDHVISDQLSYTIHHVSYRSGDLTISGVLGVPGRRGRHPLLVLGHGYLPPAQYRTSGAQAREIAYLTSRGYVVLQPDYRNYGDSDEDPKVPVARPLGYPEDLINAVVAVQRAELPFVDASRVGVFGRSMGGGASLNAAVARPDLVDALVLYSPVSSWAPDNFDRWVRGSGDLEGRVVDAYGTPGSAPDLWREASSRAYLDRLDVPVQVHHGTADRVCPVAWSRATVAELRRTGGVVELHEYRGQTHAFGDVWTTMMRRSVEFFDDHV